MSDFRIASELATAISPRRWSRRDNRRARPPVTQSGGGWPGGWGASARVRRVPLEGPAVIQNFAAPRHGCEVVPVLSTGPVPVPVLELSSPLVQSLGSHELPAARKVCVCRPAGVVSVAEWT